MAERHCQYCRQGQDAALTQRSKSHESIGNGGPFFQIQRYDDRSGQKSDAVHQIAGFRSAGVRSVYIYGSAFSLSGLARVGTGSI